jgi:hypothetical protein
LEINCLSNAINWCVRKEMIKYNPIARKVKYHTPSKARHAKEVAPHFSTAVYNEGRAHVTEPFRVTCITT